MPGYLEDLTPEEIQQFCSHPQHNPAMGLYIPPNKKYTHICPACGWKCVIYGNRVTLDNSSNWENVCK